MTQLSKFYIWTVGLFLLGFFITLNDDNLYHLFIFSVLIPFPLIVKDLWSNTSILNHPVLYWMLAFFLYMAIASLWTPVDQIAFGFDKQFSRAFYILVFCIGIAYISERHPIAFERILTVLIFAASLVALASILYWAYQYGFDFSKRLTGITRAEHSIQGAAAFAVIYLMALMRLYRTKSFWKILAYGFAVLICLSFIILAQTRGVLIAAAASTLVFLLIKRDFKPVLILMLLAAGFLLISSFWIDWSHLLERLTRGMHERPLIWQYVWHEFLNHPWFGNGTLHDTEIKINGRSVFHAHNIYLATLFHGGIVGLALYLAMVGSALYYAYKNSTEEKYLFAFITIIFASVAMLSDIGKVVLSPTDLWLYFWFPLGLVLTSKG